jgi:hypothetical protein
MLILPIPFGAFQPPKPAPGGPATVFPWGRRFRGSFEEKHSKQVEKRFGLVFELPEIEVGFALSADRMRPARRINPDSFPALKSIPSSGAWPQMNAGSRLLES